MKGSLKTLSSEEQAIMMMRYLDIDCIDTRYDYDLKKYISHYMNWPIDPDKKALLPEHIYRYEWDISYHEYGNHIEKGKVIYMAKESRTNNFGEYLCVYINDEEARDAFFKAVEHRFKESVIRKSRAEAQKQMTINGLSFIDDSEGFLDKEARKKRSY